MTRFLRCAAGALSFGLLLLWLALVAMPSLNVHRIDGRTELVGRYDPPTLQASSMHAPSP